MILIPSLGKSNKAYEYSDLGTLDTKFCVLNAVDAKTRGANILTRTKVEKAVRDGDIWVATVKNVNTGDVYDLKAKHLVNTSGPWTNQVIDKVLPIKDSGRVNLVQGSHMIVPKMFEHDYGYFLTTDTKRIIFALPFEKDFTMIGTTDVKYADDPGKVKMTDEEKDYLLDITNDWFKVQLSKKDIVWDFSGVRALYADGKDATSATRDYVIKVDTNENGKASVLNLFGGKITAAREVGEKIMNKLAPIMGIEQSVWTRTTPLYGGEFEGKTYEQYCMEAQVQYPWLSNRTLKRYVRHYGTKTHELLDGAKSYKDLGKHFGADLYAKEILYQMDKEFAQTGEDVIWRRTRIGIHLSEEERKEVDKWTEAQFKKQSK